MFTLTFLSEFPENHTYFPECLFTNFFALKPEHVMKSGVALGLKTKVSDFHRHQMLSFFCFVLFLPNFKEIMSHSFNFAYVTTCALLLLPPKVFASIKAGLTRNS